MLSTQAQSSSWMPNTLQQVETGSLRLWGMQFKPNVTVIYPRSGQMELYRHSATEILRDSTTWDKEIQAANSTTKYKGVQYLTLVGDWMLGSSPTNKLELTAHESFHVYQNSLGIPAVTSKNAHLDTPEGRALIHMELDALRKALRGNLRALYQAFEIREARRKIFPSNNEAQFELHEGLAQYTGIRIARPSEQEAVKYAEQALRFNEDRGYTNSFAYLTGPAYAILLDRHAPGWQGQVSSSAGLSELLAKTLPEGQKNRPVTEQPRYARLLKMERLTSENPSQYERWLTDTVNLLRIPNDGIGMLFNPNDRITPIGDQGVLLRNVTLRGAWGTIKAQRGLVRRNDWSEFLLAAPDKIAGNLISGQDYQIELTPDWEIVHTEDVWIFNRRQINEH